MTPETGRHSYTALVSFPVPVSAVLATAGLLQNSDAVMVIIGAMLVAPLMGPAVAAGVGTVVAGAMIAVALVPPAATVGLGLAWGEPLVMLGAGVHSY